MRFAFTDDQLAFRDAVRDLLAKECPPAVVRAAWERRRRPRRPALWARSAEMGVLGAARARGRRRARARPSSTSCCCSRRPAAPRCPSRSSSTRSSRRRPAELRERRRIRCCRGSRRRVRRHGRARSTRCVAVRRRRPTLSLVDATTACTSSIAARRDARAAGRRSTASRRVARVRLWTPAPRRCWPAAPTAAQAARRPRRARPRGAARRARPPHARPDRRVRQGAQAVRRADRQLPGVKHHLADAPHRARVRRARSSTAPPYSLADGDPDASLHVSMAKAHGVRRRHARGARGAPVPRRHRLLVRVRPAPVDEAGLGAGRGLGRRAPGTGPACADARSSVSQQTDDRRNHHARGLHRRRRPHPGRQAGRRAQPGAPGRPRRPRRSRRSSSAPTSTRPPSRTSSSAASTRIGPQAGDIARTVLARGRAARGGPRHDHRPPVRLVAAGGALRRAGRDERHAGRRRRRRRAEHEHDPDLRRDARPPSSSASPTRSRGSKGWVARYGTQEVIAVPRRRADRREVGHHARGHGGVRAREPPARALRAIDEGRFEREIAPLGEA